ncbi:murein L,D-transpeptidase catalytic domain family protein [Pontibacter harenae]|uniref:murein L,D-transpeptidase catalytic domain family protein n=1 Tax=Pontibacter harenae TaxID=2894083 RepID=UPI001E41EE85|nr:murein L,D-transpeptidase catalytic domain family protein [Pontibacter harenae]MCC9166293.1 murein L,D-transpeptidase catalytic domain family protein [Pontibacter harenae]
MKRKLLPLFAPLILSPVATSTNLSAANIKTKISTKKLKTSTADTKVMEFDTIACNVYQQMDLREEGLQYEIFNKALTGYYNLRKEGKLGEKPYITIVDFTKSSTEKRLWVIDVEGQEVLHNTYVSHGRNSGVEFAENFSNDKESFMSSIGFYVTQDTYHGKHGLSLKLDGVDEGFNSNAMDRCIVIHGAEYANESIIEQTGRLGRSLGCPALPMDDYEDVIDTVEGGTVLFVHAANDVYTSDYLDHASAMAELVKEQNEEIKATANELAKE